METITYYLLTFIFGGLFVLCLVYKVVKRQDYELDELRSWKGKEILKDKQQADIEEQKQQIHIKQNALNLLMCEMGDILHGVTGLHYKLVDNEDAELRRKWVLVSSIALLIRSYYNSPNSADCERFKNFLEKSEDEAIADERLLIQIMSHYKEGILNHKQILELCHRLLFNASVKEAIHLSINLK